MIDKDEYVNSESGALFGIFTENYQDHTKEISIFISDQHFILHDHLNEDTIAKKLSTPDGVREVIDEHLQEWKHKVDFKLALIEHAEMGGWESETPSEPLKATDYYQKLTEKETEHEQQIIKNHHTYLQELGKLGDELEHQEHNKKFEKNEDIHELKCHRVLGSLTDSQLIKVVPRHPLSADDLDKELPSKPKTRKKK